MSEQSEIVRMLALRKELDPDAQDMIFMPDPPPPEVTATPKPSPLYDSIGALIDGWETMPNDIKADLRHSSPSFVGAVEGIVNAMEFYESWAEGAKP